PADQTALAIAGFLDACRSDNTRAAYRADLGHFAAWCDGSAGPLDLLAVDTDDLARYRTACEVAGAGPATVARRLSAIVSFGAYASELGVGTGFPSRPNIARPTIDAESTAEVLSDEDAEALLDAA